MDVGDLATFHRSLANRQRIPGNITRESLELEA